MSIFDNEAIEALATAIYAAMPYDEAKGEKPEWTPRGNSFKQGDARRVARNYASILESSLRDNDKLVDGKALWKEKDVIAVTGIEHPDYVSVAIIKTETP